MFYSADSLFDKLTKKYQLFKVETIVRRGVTAYKTFQLQFS